MQSKTISMPAMHTIYQNAQQGFLKIEDTPKTPFNRRSGPFFAPAN